MTRKFIIRDLETKTFTLNSKYLLKKNNNKTLQCNFEKKNNDDIFNEWNKVGSDLNSILYFFRNINSEI